MKSFSLIAVTLLLLCCKSETKITPATLTSFEYGVYIGISGQVIKLTVFPQNQVLQRDYRSDKTCELRVSESDWRELVSLFDKNAFKNVKVGDQSNCPDAGAKWIIARSPAEEVEAIWGPCTGGDPTGIQPIIAALDKRMQAMFAFCK